jgi:hypothetical protein
MGKTLKLTITESGMHRALQMYRAELGHQGIKAGMVDVLIDLAFSLGANSAATALGAEFTQAHIDAIRTVRECIIATK